jgi:hypothetical protein
MNKRNALLVLAILFLAALLLVVLTKDNVSPERAAENEILPATTTGTSAGRAITQAERSAVETHIREHISELSSQKEVLGGKYYITKITFLSGRSGTVEYEDGHIAHVADFTYVLGEAHQVVITSFTLRDAARSSVEPGKQNNFSKPGNIVQGEGNEWVLVYEEPGKPALRANLQFTASSSCDMGAGSASCEGIRWKAGERVRVEGNLSGQSLIVSKVTKL